MLYIDSASRSDVERLLATGLFAGVTTNPTILARAGLGIADTPAVVAWAQAAGARRVFAQVVGTTAEAMEQHGWELAGLGPDVVVKVHATLPGLTAARRLTHADVPVLVTAIYHASQAVLAQAAGAGWIAPYVGRMFGLGMDATAQVRQMSATLAAGGTGCRVLAASVRTADQVAELAAAGAADLTLSIALCDSLVSDPNTVAAAATFERDAAGPGGA